MGSNPILASFLRLVSAFPYFPPIKPE